MRKTNQIEQLMLQRGWSIYQLAAKSGMTPQALYMYFRGKTKTLHMATKKGIAKAFRVPVEELFHDEGI